MSKGMTIATTTHGAARRDRLGQLRQLGSCDSSLYCGRDDLDALLRRIEGLAREAQRHAEPAAAVMAVELIRQEFDRLNGTGDGYGHVYNQSERDGHDCATAVADRADRPAGGQLG